MNVLRPHQNDCNNRIQLYLQNNNAGLVKMFCGSGKSLVIYTQLLNYTRKLSVVVVPSINLITQFNRDYLYCNNNYNLLTVCSKDELKTGDAFTTDSSQILNFLLEDNPKIVLITYQSLDILYKITKDNNITIDLCCFDEAHHILGECTKNILFNEDEDDEEYENRELRYDDDLKEQPRERTKNFTDICKKILYFTATPKNSNGIVMHHPDNSITVDGQECEMIDDINDEEDYSEVPHCGELIYEYSHLDGVRDGILNDFRIRVDLYTDKTNESLFKAISRSIIETGNNRVLTFHSKSEIEADNTSVVSFSSVENERIFSECFYNVLREEFPQVKNPYKRIRFKGLTSKTKDDSSLLKELDSTTLDEVYVLASCRKIGEGVDTRNANMVVFVNPKQSYVDIIQNIGRVCRKNETTRGLATVVIPAYVDVNKYAECKTAEERDRVIRDEMNQKGDFNGILNVLSALRQEDPHTFNLCLNYPNRYSREETDKALQRIGLKKETEEYEISDLFKEYKTEYDNTKSREENFQTLSENIGKNIVVHNSSIEEGDTVIGDDESKPTEHIVENDGKYSLTSGKASRGSGRAVRTNPRPNVHVNDEIRVLWSVENEEDINLDDKIFGGYIRSSVVGCSVDEWMIKLEKVKKYIDRNGRLPNRYDKKSEVKKLGNWIDRQKSNYFKNKYIMVNQDIRNRWIEFVNSEEYKHYFISNTESWIDTLEEVKRYIGTNGKLPNKRDCKDEIKILGQWIIHQKINYSKNKYIMLNKNIKIRWENFVNDDKYKHYFLSNVQQWIDILESVKKYIDENGKLPSSESKNPEVRTLGVWICTQKAKYLKTKEIISDFNTDIRVRWENFVNDDKYKHYFLSNNQMWIYNLESVKKYIDENGKLPSSKDKNPEVKKLGIWICTQKQNYPKNKEIMSDTDIRLLWESFLTEYSQYFKEYLHKNPISSKEKPSRKSVLVFESDTDSDTDEKEYKTPHNPRTLSRYQKTTHKMSIQNSNTTHLMFRSQPDIWIDYHNSRDHSFAGYDRQECIPVNKIIKYIEGRASKRLRILDLGCGRNLINQHFAFNTKLHITGYDHVSHNGSIACDISHLDVEDETADICVYSQSLMGSNWKEYIKEGFRVLRYNGEMIISESRERYETVKEYINSLGYTITHSECGENDRWFYIHVVNNKK